MFDGSSQFSSSCLPDKGFGQLAVFNVRFLSSHTSHFPEIKQQQHINKYFVTFETESSTRYFVKIQNDIPSKSRYVLNQTLQAFIWLEVVF